MADAPAERREYPKVDIIMAFKEVKEKTGTITLQQLKRLLFRCAATLISIEEASTSIVT